MNKRFLILLGAIVLAVSVLHVQPAKAVNPDEMLPNPTLEKRAREISKGLRCLVCQNETIDDSDAELAHDLRVLVRERLVAGDTDQQVVDYIVKRYGDYVLLDPPLKPETYILWISPVVLAILALLAIVAFFRRKHREAENMPQALSEQEEHRLNKILRNSQNHD